MSNLLKHLQQENDEKAHYQQALDYALEYLDSVRHRPVFPSDAAIDGMRALDQALPVGPSAAADILHQLHAIGSPATVAQGGGRYFGFVNGGVIPAALAARILADVWDQNAALHIMSPIAAKLEAICETWLVDLLDLPADTAAGFVSGTSTATLCGLLAGRNAILSRQGLGCRRARTIRRSCDPPGDERGGAWKRQESAGFARHWPSSDRDSAGRRSRQNGHPRSTKIGRQYVADLAGGQCQQRRF